MRARGNDQRERRLGSAPFLASTGDPIGAFATIAVALITVVGGFYTQRTIARKTLDEPRPSRGQQAAPPSAPAQPLDQRRSREVEGFIVRFIILYLVVQAWSALLQVTNPFVNTFSFFGYYVESQYVYIGEGFIYALIFLALGLPLLLDILRRYGIRGGGFASRGE